jgi:anti-anti-sigma regulatory factor
MLRITRIEPTAGKAILRLEGKLIGPWVNELKDYCEIVRREGRQLSLEMAEVSFADRAGIALLRDLEGSGVELAGCPPFISEELNW